MVLQATIVYDSRDNPGKEESCNALCGTDWSLSENIALARDRVRERFGARAEVSFIDVARRGPPVGLENVPLPALLINGQPRITGRFDIRRLMDAVEAGLEMEGKDG